MDQNNNNSHNNDNSNSSCTNHHNNSDNSNINNISSIDYFLLDDNNSVHQQQNHHTHHHGTVAPTPTVASPTTTRTVAQLLSSSLLRFTTTTSPSSTTASSSTAHHQQQQQQQQQETISTIEQGTAEHPINISTTHTAIDNYNDNYYNNSNHDNNNHDNNRCRLDSYNTATSTSCVTGASPTNHGNPAAAAVTVEHIYFDDDDDGQQVVTCIVDPTTTSTTIAAAAATTTTTSTTTTAANGSIHAPQQHPQPQQPIQQQQLIQREESLSSYSGFVAAAAAAADNNNAEASSMMRMMTTPLLSSSAQNDHSNDLDLDIDIDDADQGSMVSPNDNAIGNTNNSFSVSHPNNHSSYVRSRTWSNGSQQQQQQHRRRRNSRSRPRRRGREVPELSGLNILNAMTYSIHLIIWWTIGVWGLHHILYTHWEQTNIHETLITPSTFVAHYLWVPIMITEAMFTIAQLLPYYRARPIIRSGTSYFFFYTVLLQIAYTILYGCGLFVFSFICIVLALVALLSLLASQQYHSTADHILPNSHNNHNHTILPDNHHYSTSSHTLIRTLSGGGSITTSSNMIGWNNSSTGGRWLCSYRMVEYVLFTFPFYLHTGWLILMAVDHYSLLFRRYHSTIDAQLASDIVGLGILFVSAMYSLQQNGYPDFVIPTVVIWSYIGIACRLCYPSDTMIDTYGLVAIGSIRIATFCFMGIVSCCMIPNIVICLSREFCTINVVELE